MLIEQAIYGDQDVGGYRFLARSPGFADDWLPEAQRLCTAFGERPAGAACPGAVFARPFGPRHVAVVQVADQGRDDVGRPGALAFRLLVVPRPLYADLGGDPFFLADEFPPPWEARGDLPALNAPGAPAKRTLDQVRRVIDVEHDRTALLLGGAQVLVDGGRLVFQRAWPDSRLLRDLWMLLPTATRTALWPATFAFGNANRFHVLATPHPVGPDYDGYIPEAQAGDYPEGRYELALQTAVEAGDEAEMDALFARRSRAQAMRLAVGLLLVFLVAAVVLGLPLGKREPDAGPAGKDAKEKEKEKRPDAPMKLPAEEDLPALTDPQRAQFASRLQELAGKLGVKLEAGDGEKALGEAVVELDRRIDSRQGKGKPARDPGNLAELGPAQRRLRALLWKHGVAEYADTRLNPAELVERLEKKLARGKWIKEGDGE
jgi:hypothetical protein